MSLIRLYYYSVEHIQSQYIVNILCTIAKTASSKVLPSNSLVYLYFYRHFICLVILTCVVLQSFLMFVSK